MASEDEMLALKHLVFSQQGCRLSKQILGYLLENSQGLSREVCFTLWQGNRLRAEELIKAVSDIEESVSRLVSMVMQSMGSGFEFSAAFGHYDLNGVFQANGHRLKSGSEYQDAIIRYTFWLARTQRSDFALALVPDTAELRAIDLE